MIKYIIFWVLATTVQIPCPYANKIDEFGRKSDGGMISCAVLHTETTYSTQYKTFESKEEAEIFYNKAKSQIPQYPLLMLGEEIISIKMYKLNLIKTDSLKSLTYLETSTDTLYFKYLTD